MNVLEVKGLYKNYGNREILKDVSFHVGLHEVVGFVGPNGSGKSTTMKCIAGLTEFHQGEILVFGHDIQKERIAALREQSSLIEGPALYPELSGKDNIKLFASLRGVSKERVAQMIELTKLGKHINRKVGQYSMGMKQRVAIAIALMSQPKVIMLDEPTNGLDPSGILDLLSMVKEVAKTEEVGFLFSSHTLSDVEKIADRVIYIKNGEIVDVSTYEKSQKLTYQLKLSQDATQVFERLSLTYTYHEILTEYTIDLDAHTLSDVIQALQEANIQIHEISKIEQSVEAMYKDIYHDED
ncbi:hypothetical protein A4S06_00235 [Erysipelotrichaceae bacterium MTC7]|nr:hypothetical protein A4S06_00235 [Erysipelotrichaceae bacterium MTC7]